MYAHVDLLMFSNNAVTMPATTIYVACKVATTMAYRSRGDAWHMPLRWNCSDTACIQRKNNVFHLHKDVMVAPSLTFQLRNKEYFYD